METDKNAPKWWDTEPFKPPQKWAQLDHNGVVFPPPYQPHGKRMLYDGKEIELSPAQEECATWFAAILESDHAKNPTFCKNFFRDWVRLLRSPKERIRHPEIVNFSKCNFKPMFDWTQQSKEEEKERRKDAAYKKKRKEDKEAMDQLYGFALVDGVREKVGNFKVEPPGLFRGRGKHPKTGMIKKRLVPEQIIINVGPGTPVPPCPVQGHNWGGVIHDNTVTYIAKWQENINGAHKFVYLHSSSRFKGESDRDKYEKARKLKRCIKRIRSDYEQKLTARDMATRQLATAVWIIDRLAIRVGNEKDVSEEADTVGVCTLRLEHIQFDDEDRKITLEFLGKDSMPYKNTIPVPGIIYQNLKYCARSKKSDQDLFEKINPTIVNDYLKELMPGLSAKVFRTFNASITLCDELRKDTQEWTGKITINSNVNDKVFFYNCANRQVAILCNHMRTVNKDKFDESLQKKDEKIKESKDKLKLMKRQLKLCKGTVKPKNAEEKEWAAKKKPDVLKKQIERAKTSLQKKEYDQHMKKETKEIALGTSKINYMDPRITVAFAKRMEVPIEKLFNKSLLDKFPWAMAAAPTYMF